MTFDSHLPFNDLPPLPPKQDVETRSVLRKIPAAARALAELKGLGSSIPDQSLLINSIVLQEAKASSEIENIITTNDALFRAFTVGSGKIDPATKEVLRYRQALWDGFDGLKKKPLSTNLFIRIVQTITKDSRGIRNLPGTVIGDAKRGLVLYVPPEGEALLRDKLHNLEEFINSDSGMDPLIKLALIHYQFEAIHPFFDGNGRAGRIINILYLVQAGLLELPVLYLSRAIIKSKTKYYALLRGVTEKSHWEPWILFMLEAVEETALFTRERILRIRTLMTQTMESSRKQLPPRVYSKELIETIFRQPYTKGKYLVDAEIAKRQTAAEYLHELEKIGILKSKKIGKETLFLNVALLKLLES